MTQNRRHYDRVVLGAGMFGLYAALRSLQAGKSVLLLEHDEAPFLRASWINQARVHMGYHYPRSFTTAVKSIEYYNRFTDDFNFAILKEFKKIYAISNNFSYSNAKQFHKFCKHAQIPIEEIDASRYFRNGMCDYAYECNEYTFDAKMICQYLIEQLESYDGFSCQYNIRIDAINKGADCWSIGTDSGVFFTPFLINATYASLNQMLVKANIESIPLKYELCEIVLCNVSDNIKDVGITVMDGPFFSIMPFGKTGYHSLSAVSYTPHYASDAKLPTFSCQVHNPLCSPEQLDNCNSCRFKPASNFKHMLQLSQHYLNEGIDIKYDKSLFSMKTILVTSEVDDSRPTILKKHNEEPTFLSVFSGKINTIYDLDEVL